MTSRAFFTHGAGDDARGDFRNFSQNSRQKLNDEKVKTTIPQARRNVTHAMEMKAEFTVMNESEEVVQTVIYQLLVTPYELLYSISFESLTNKTRHTAKTKAPTQLIPVTNHQTNGRKSRSL